MSGGFDRPQQELLAAWGSILRATRSLDDEAMASLEKALASDLSGLAPIETLSLETLLAALEESALPAAQREAALLFVAQCGEEVGVPCALPAALQAMAPGERRLSIQSLAKNYYAEVAERVGDAEENYRGRTPTLDLNALPANDPLQRSASLQAIGGRYMGQVFAVDATSLIIGRGEKVQILIDDEGVSRHHARIETRHDGKGEEHLLIDLGSKNGIVVNGFGIDEHTLQDGDRIQIGATTILRFGYHDQLEQDFQKRVMASVSVDGLTGVYNRRFFLDLLNSEVAFAGRHTGALSYLALSVDGYQDLAQRRGYAARDEALRVTADRLQSTLRVEDVLGRTGEDTFGLILRGIDHSGAVSVGQRLGQLVEEATVGARTESFVVTVSMGLATVTIGTPTTADVLRTRAEERLVLAQETGNHLVGRG